MQKWEIVGEFSCQWALRFPSVTVSQENTVHWKANAHVLIHNNPFQRVTMNSMGKHSGQLPAGKKGFLFQNLLQEEI